MKVLILAHGADTGGQGIRIRQGFLDHKPDWQVDVVNGSRNELGYPEQFALRTRERATLPPRLYAEAGVVHLRLNLTAWRKYDRGQGKPVVLHHHGSMYREGHGGISHEARQVGAVEIASTIDLTLLEPNVQWLPSPYDVAELRAIRQAHYQPGDRIRIAHFPTSSRIKSTDAFLAATQSLARKYPIDVLTNVKQGRIRHQPWSDVLAQKAQADIYFDQVKLGYGNNAIEAWGMGIPVVAGVQDPAVWDAMLGQWGTLPFVEANESTLEATLESLIQSEQMRREYAEIGTAHVEQWHAADKVVDRLMGIYASAQPTHQVVLPRRGQLRRAA